MEPWLLIVIAAIAFYAIGQRLRNPGSSALRRAHRPKTDKTGPEWTDGDAPDIRGTDEKTEDTYKPRPTYGAARYRTRKDERKPR